MASLGAGVATQRLGLTFATGVSSGFLGMGIIFAAGMVDNMLAARIRGRGKSAFAPIRTLETNETSYNPGASRVFAFGRRVRVPTHMLFHKAKERSAGSAKSETGMPPLVYSDFALAVNDRLTSRLLQLRGNGKLLYWTERNLVSIATAGLTVSVTTGVEHGFLTLTTTSVDEPDFASKFTAAIQDSGTAESGTATTLVDTDKTWSSNQWIGYWVRIMSGTGSGQVRSIASNGGTSLTVGTAWTTNPGADSAYQIEGAADVVKLAGFITSAGASINAGYWRVVTASPHAATPSALKLTPLTNQSVAGVVATAGNNNTPASVTRVDDAAIESGYTVTEVLDSSGSRIGLRIQRGGAFGVGAPALYDLRTPFSVGATVRLAGYTPSGLNSITDFVVDSFNGEQGMTLRGSGIPAGPYTAGTTTNAGEIRFWITPTSPPNLFDLLEWHQGTETQTADDIITQTKAVAQTPGYRGVAYLAIDQFNETGFGGMPPQLDALIEPDPDFSWQDALLLLCVRAGFAESEIDVADVPPWVFDGAYVLGAQPGLTSLQPILVAGQIVGQERDDRIAFFPIADAEVTQIENGVNFSDMGATVGEGPPADHKVIHGQVTDEYLPNSLSIRFQDPDKSHTEQLESWTVRNPSGMGKDNPQEVDLSGSVMSKREARNLAATLVRRAWLNNKTVEKDLPICYVDQLENDVLTFTDDVSGDAVTARVLRREIGTNLMLHLIGVREDVDAEVTGSPAQPSSGTYPSPLPNVPDLRIEVLDIGPLTDQLAYSPGLLFAVTAKRGGRWSGARLYESTDGGTNYDLVDTFDAQPVMGETITTMATGTPYEPTLALDTSTIVDVRVETGILYTVTQAQAEAGQNWCVVGNEICAFTTATLLSDGIYRLTNWLRGIRNTFREAATSKPIASRFVLLFGFFTFGGRFRDLRGLVTIGQSVRHKIVPTGRSPGDVTAIVTTFGGWNARPFIVKSVVKALPTVAPFDAKFTFQRWTRLNLPPGAAAPWPLDEPFEEYEMQIYEPTGTTVVRTLTVTSVGTGSTEIRDPWVTYTVADQTTDGYTPASTETFWISVRQRGLYGYGLAWKQEI